MESPSRAPLKQGPDGRRGVKGGGQRETKEKRNGWRNPGSKLGWVLGLAGLRCRSKGAKNRTREKGKTEGGLHWAGRWCSGEQPQWSCQQWTLFQTHALARFSHVALLPRRMTSEWHNFFGARHAVFNEKVPIVARNPRRSREVPSSFRELGPHHPHPPRT